jgi:hypothetical protein
MEKQRPDCKGKVARVDAIAQSTDLSQGARLYAGTSLFSLLHRQWQPANCRSESFLLCINESPYSAYCDHFAFSTNTRDHTGLVTDFLCRARALPRDWHYVAILCGLVIKARRNPDNSHDS